MEIQKSFSKTAFGGFKKEEVTQYIDEIITKYDEEIAVLKADLEGANAQIYELKSIIEEQYKKIVEMTANIAEITSNNETVADENSQYKKRIEELVSQLKPFVDAQTEVKNIVDSARKKSYEISLKVKQQAHETTEEAKFILEQANQRAKSILEPANSQAETLINSAREKARDIIFSAKKQETQLLEQVKGEIEQTILLSEEKERNAEKLIEEARLEADTIINRAKEEADGEKNHFESCLKSLETQKSKLLLSLDEIKGSVQAIQIVRLPKSEIESFQALRQSTTEAIRKKFAMLNKERQSGNTRD